MKKDHFNKGRNPWNKGLTTQDPRVKRNVDKRTKTVIERGTFALENNPRWKGGKRAYKDMALKHYGRKCMSCGKEDEMPKMIHVHHKDGNRNNNDMKNLKVLCAKCHSAEHPRKASDYQKQIASKTHKGKIMSEEQKQKIRIAMIGNTNRRKE